MHMLEEDSSRKRRRRRSNCREFYRKTAEESVVPLWSTEKIFRNTKGRKFKCLQYTQVEMETKR